MSEFLDQIYGVLPDSWHMTTIGSLVDVGLAHLQTGPFGTLLQASEYIQIGIPVVAVKNIGVNRLILDDSIPRVSQETYARLRRYSLEKNDILFGRKGAVDRRALIQEHEAGWLQGSDCIRLRILGDAVDAKYVSYIFGSPLHQQWIIRNAEGSTMPSLNQQILHRIPLPLPPIDDQRAIAQILGSLDDKIEANRRMNETLEVTARTIFKSWFVDFDPVHYKLRGEIPPGMDAETARLFPDSFEESALGWIPRGWRVSTIGEEVKVVGGSTPSTTELSYWDGGTINWATPKDLSDLSMPILLSTARQITHQGLAQISSRLLPQGTVLLSSRAPVGYLAIAETPVAINQGFIAMICDNVVSNYYILWWAASNMETIKGKANGTTFQEVSKGSFRPIPVLVPSYEVLLVFNSIVEPVYSQIVSNERQSRTLAETRDVLLPKLVSGELRVNEFEDVEEIL